MRLVDKSSIVAVLCGCLLTSVIGLLLWSDLKQASAYKAYDRANVIKSHVTAFGALAMEAMQRPSDRIQQQWLHETHRVRDMLADREAVSGGDAQQLELITTELSKAFSKITFDGGSTSPQLRRIQIGRLVAKLQQMTELADRLVENSAASRSQAARVFQTSVWTTIGLLILGVPLLWLGFRKAALRPLKDLTHDVAGATLQQPLSAEAWQRADEFGQLGREFAEMQNRLITAFDEVADKAARLEQSNRKAQEAADHARKAERRTRDALDAVREAQEETALAARHDTLTGLGNRTLLEELSQKMAGHQPDSSGTLVLAIDLDRFKDVNDTYGHAAGDAVLTACGQRLISRAVSGQSSAFRIGGDEFVLVLDFDGSETHAQWYCDQLLDELLCPTEYKGVELSVGASIGLALLSPGEQLLNALKRADLALYEAKHRGRNQAVAFSATLGAAHDAKLKLINDFKTALERDEISIEVQPQVCAKTYALQGVEVLARWDHPKRGRQSPAVFVEIAEELKLQADLDRRVLDLALEARKTIEAELGRAPQVSVNVSANRLTSPTLLEELRRRPDLPQSGLAFEVLETAFLDDVSGELELTITALKDMGIKIEVDDFGTGHASFASVLALKPDRLKIDRMFVTGVDKDDQRKDLLRGIVDMANRVSVSTIVEGVETLGEADAAAEVGADTLQGFAFSRPLSVKDFIAWAKKKERRVA
ncbi:putative bifunctional diguanylate cyclase/phosphodiesterase [Leisingera sp. S232]|uniref:putative bifunctional diguanylate cyclase/phosphodiesterase n=1 Tax=Leisingera sp. S232 TaxID=3415132 RepID=UPI003C7BC0B0